MRVVKIGRAVNVGILLWCIAPWMLLFFGTVFLNTSIEMTVVLMVSLLVLLITKKAYQKLRPIELSLIICMIIYVFETIRAESNINAGVIIVAYLILSIVFSTRIFDINDYRFMISNLILLSTIISVMVVFGNAILLSDKSRSTLQLLNGELADPNFSLSFFTLAFPMACHRAIYRRKKFSKLIYTGIVGLYIIAVIMTGSRGTLLAVAIMTLFMILDYTSNKEVKSPKKMALLLFLTFAGVISIVFAEQILPEAFYRRIFGGDATASRSFQYRLEMWNAANGLFKDKPLLGYGTRAFDVFARETIGVQRDVHNTYIRFLFMSGILGGVSCLAPMFYYIVRFLKRKEWLLAGMWISFLSCHFFISSNDKFMFWGYYMLLLSISRFAETKLKLNR